MDKNFIKDVGGRIAQYRKLVGMNQTELAERVGTNQKVISAWEKGRSDPGSDNIALLSKALGVSPEDLLGFHPDGIKSVRMPDSSMEPQIYKDDVLTVQENVPVTEGDIVLADTPKEKGIIRKLFYLGVHTVLLAFNPAVPPIGVHNADIKGKVTDIHRKL